MQVHFGTQAQGSQNPGQPPRLRRFQLPEAILAQSDAVPPPKATSTTTVAESRGNLITRILNSLKNLFSRFLPQSLKNRLGGDDDTTETNATEAQQETRRRPKKSIMRGLRRMFLFSLSPRGIAEWAIAIMTGFTVPLPAKHFVEGFMGYDSLFMKRRWPRVLSGHLLSGVEHGPAFKLGRKK